MLNVSSFDTIDNSSILPLIDIVHFGPLKHVCRERLFTPLEMFGPLKHVCRERFFTPLEMSHKIYYKCLDQKV